VKWYDAANKYDEAVDYELEAVPEDWQRELVALERALTHIMNGGYIQFLVNCGRPTYLYASQAFKKIGAAKTAKLLDRCQALIEEHFPTEGKSIDELAVLMGSELHKGGEIIKEEGSILPDSVYDRIGDFDSEFMEHDWDDLAQTYFEAKIKAGKKNK
jgi:Domain of unknown function (DUF4375)